MASTPLEIEPVAIVATEDAPAPLATEYFRLLTEPVVTADIWQARYKVVPATDPHLDPYIRMHVVGRERHLSSTELHVFSPFSAEHYQSGPVFVISDVSIDGSQVLLDLEYAILFDRDCYQQMHTYIVQRLEEWKFHRPGTVPFCAPYKCHILLTQATDRLHAHQLLVLFEKACRHLMGKLVRTTHLQLFHDDQHLVAEWPLGQFTSSPPKHPLALSL